MISQYDDIYKSMTHAQLCTELVECRRRITYTICSIKQCKYELQTCCISYAEYLGDYDNMQLGKQIETEKLLDYRNVLRDYIERLKLIKSAIKAVQRKISNETES